MTRSLPKCGVPLLFVLLVATIACGRTDAAVTGPSPAFEPSPVQSWLGVEPLSVRPEFLHGGSCVESRPFGVRVGFVVRGGHDVILRGLRFSFIDRFGATAVPVVIPIPSLTTPLAHVSTIPTSSPVPLPGIAALPGLATIPMPNASPVSGIVFAAGTSRVLPYFVRFGCGVFAEGVLVIVADAGDRAGRFSTSELRVRIGS